MDNYEKLKKKYKKASDQCWRYLLLMHKQLLKDHKKFIRFCDVLMILAIVSNFGALFLTNIMVAEKVYEEAEEKGTEVKWVETNPAAQKLHNLEGPSPEQKPLADKMLQSLITQSFYWAILISMYILIRTIAYNKLWLGVLFVPTILLCVMLTNDFVRDLGLWIGSLLFG